MTCHGTLTKFNVAIVKKYILKTFFFSNWKAEALLGYAVNEIKAFYMVKVKERNKMKCYYMSL